MDFDLVKPSWVLKGVALGLLTAAIGGTYINASFTYEAIRPTVDDSAIAITWTALISGCETIALAALFDAGSLTAIASGFKSSRRASRLSLFISRGILACLAFAIISFDLHATWSQIAAYSLMVHAFLTALAVLGNEVGFILSKLAWDMSKDSTPSSGNRGGFAPQSRQQGGKSRVEDFMDV